MSIWNLLFPPKCAVCGDAVSDDGVFCAVCHSGYEQMKRRLCRVCGKMQKDCRCKSTELVRRRLKVTQRHLFAFDEDAARTLIYKLKRKNLSSLQRFLSREYADILASELSAGEGAVLLYPPRSRLGIQKYGFDQARVIALGVGKITGIPVMDIFERGVGSEQKTLSAADRSKNASSVYFLKENNDIYGRTAVIIDDVVTSGSTAARLCELAFCAGAERAIVISAAKTVLG